MTAPGWYPHPHTGQLAWWDGQAWVSAGPGWYLGPDGTMRWWDGAAWAAPAAAVPAAPAASRGMHALWVVPLVLVALIALMASAGGDGSSRGASGSSSRAASSGVALTVIDYTAIDGGCDPDSFTEESAMHCVMQMSGVHYDVVFENVSGSPIEMERSSITLVDVDGNEYAAASSDPSNADVVLVNPGEVGDFTCYFPGAPAGGEVAELWVGDDRVDSSEFVSPEDSDYAPSLS